MALVTAAAFAATATGTSSEKPSVEPVPSALTAEAQQGPAGEGLLSRYLVSPEAAGPSAHSSAQAELVDWALGRFSAAGLHLPELDIHFQSSTLDCGGRQGLYHPQTRSLFMCVAQKRTMLHELAHAWTDTRLTEELRETFLEVRQLRSWDDRNLAWDQRGTEHASEIIAWALMDTPLHVPTTPAGPGGPIVFRLLTIPDSDVEALTYGYALLTGLNPPFRHPSEWQGIIDIGEPGVAYSI